MQRTTGIIWEIGAWVPVAAVACYMLLWLVDASNPQRGEYGVGAALSWLVGAPIWGTFIAFAIFNHRKEPASRIKRALTIAVIMAVFAAPYVAVEMRSAV